VSEVLARRDRALTPEETEELLRDRLGPDAILASTQEYGIFTVHLAQEHWVEAARRCRDEALLGYDLFDNLFGVDAREEGFDVVTVLYSTSTGNRIVLRTRCDGGRDAPTCPSLTELYRGADWMERETWDMFGIEFTGHPSLEPRLLTAENFEGWPLRKDFHLTSRVVKPWPGVKEPAELDEDGNIIAREPRLGDAPGPYELDKAMAEQAKLANPLPEAELTDTIEPSASDAGAAEADASDEADNAPQIDQETYDRLIAEGKSDRIARSKAKAAFVKKERARQAEAAAGGSAAAATDEAPDPEQTASDKAEQRRREQAEARRRKAEERASGSDDGSDAGEQEDDA
jgi:NADH:ubiquinone oxidoreductase subunit C